MLKLIVLGVMSVLVWSTDVRAQLAATPNRPIDAVNLLDLDWSQFPPASVCSTPGPEYGGGFRTSDPTAPRSGPSIFRHIKDTNSGHGGMAFYCTFGGQTTKRIYAVIWKKAPGNFKGLHSNNNKIHGYISQQRYYFVPVLVGFCSDGQVCNNLQLRPHFNGMANITPGSANNCHVSGVIYTGNECAGINFQLSPNVQDHRFTLGSWHRIEWILDIGSCTYQKLDCRDGKVYAWLDGIQTHKYDNINWHPAEFDGISYTHTWDGQDAGKPNPAQWDDDHYTLARYGALTPGGGGDTTPPPVPQNVQVLVQ